MLIEMWSPAFKEKGKQRPIIKFKKGLNVVLGKEDGAMSIGKSSALLAIDFVFGGNAYVKSDGVKEEGHHSIYFAFEFDGSVYRFERNTKEPSLINICKDDYSLTDRQYTKDEFTDWLKERYNMNFSGLSFRTALTSFFRIYGKNNHNETNPLMGFPGENKEQSIDTILKLFDQYKYIERYNKDYKEQKDKLAIYNKAKKLNYISSFVGGKKKYEENQQRIHELEIELNNLKEVADKGYSNKDIEKNTKKANLRNTRLELEKSIQAKEAKLRLINMSLDFGLYPTEADFLSLQEFFPSVNLKKLYLVENFHQKLANILDEQFKNEKIKIENDIKELKNQLQIVNEEMKNLGFVGFISKDFLDKHTELADEIKILKYQNKEYLRSKEIKEAKQNANEVLKKNIEKILREIESTINGKMKELNDSLFSTHRRPPYLYFKSHNSYDFKTPKDTGTGSNYKGMIVYDLSILFTTALPAIAHDSLLFKNLEKDVEDGIIKIYNTSNKQIFIAYDKQNDCRENTRAILEKCCVLKLSNNNSELYGKSWNVEE